MTKQDAAEPVRTDMFGPSALATPANGLTVIRLLATPILLFVIVKYGASWLSLLLWTALALTDTFDGRLARRQGTTTSGAFLDPLADKFIVLGALTVLVIKGPFSLLPVVLIAIREVGISIYRTVLGAKGVSVPARPMGKLKAVVQDIAVALALMAPVRDHLPWLPSFVLWIAVAFTIVSGAQYLIDSDRSTRAV